MKEKEANVLKHSNNSPFLEEENHNILTMESPIRYFWEKIL